MQFAVNNVQRAVRGRQEASNYYRSPVEVRQFLRLLRRLNRRSFTLSLFAAALLRIL